MDKFVVDIWLFLSVGFIARCGCRDAILYKHSKSWEKKFVKNLSATERLLQLYPESFCFAPRHLKIFQIIRIVNALAVIISILLFTLKNDQHEQVYRVFFYMKLFSFYIPFFLYCLNPKFKKPRSKRLDFSQFKKP